MRRRQSASPRNRREWRRPATGDDRGDRPAGRCADTMRRARRAACRLRISPSASLLFGHFGVRAASTRASRRHGTLPGCGGSGGRFFSRPGRSARRLVQHAAAHPREAARVGWRWTTSDGCLLNSSHPSPTSHAVRFAHSTPVHDRLVLSRCVTSRRCLNNAALVVNLHKFIVFIATVN